MQSSNNRKDHLKDRKTTTLLRLRYMFRRWFTTARLKTPEIRYLLRPFINHKHRIIAYISKILFTQILK